MKQMLSPEEMSQAYEELERKALERGDFSGRIYLDGVK